MTMKARPATPPILVLSLLLAACGFDTPGQDGDGVTVRDSAGVPIVENRGEGWDAASAWRISEEPALVLGADPASEAEVLDQVWAGARLADGRVVVVDGNTQEIRYFGADGSHLATAGGNGGGPGEFRQVGWMMRLPGDSLALEDAASLKVVVLGPRGELAGERTFELQAFRALDGAGPCYYGRVFPDGSRTACVAEPGGPERVVMESGLSHIGFGLVRTFDRFVWLDSALSASDTLGLNGGIEQFGADVGEDSPVYELHPFYARTFVAASPEPQRFYIGVNPAYAIEVWAPGGRLERVVRRMGAQRVPSPELRAAAWEQLAQRNASRPELEARWNRVREQMVEPDSLPAIYGLTVSTDGYLWVQRSHYLEEGPRIHDVFDPEGHFLGAISLPPRFRVLEIGPDYVLGVRLGEFDEETVETYTLERG